MPFDRNAGTKPGLEIWRIKNFDTVVVEQKEFGTFYSGDCYIVMKTNEDAKSRKLTRDIHFWLGKESSQDEQGTAAIKTVELDDKLGGEPRQHREVQGHESPLFVSYFAGGIKSLKGGFDSGFRKVEAEKFEPRLFHVKGKRNVRVAQVELRASSLNQGDVFILDLGKVLYQWNGTSANKYEKYKGLEFAQKVKDNDRHGEAKLVVLDAPRDDNQEFWSVLGNKGQVQSAEAGGNDDAVKAAESVLYRISDSTGSMKVLPVGRGKLDRAMLSNNDAFLVDAGNQIFVWVGKYASKDERRHSMAYGQQYIKDKSYPSWVGLTRCADGGENAAFKSLFSDWYQEEEKAYFQNSQDKGTEVRAERRVSVQALYDTQKATEEKMATFDGKIKVYRIENFQKVAVPEAEYGQFYSGDSYIVTFSYKEANKEKHIIYFWQGRHTSIDEKGTSALLSVDLDKQLTGANSDAVQVRVVQNKEPNHFMGLFKGKMVVHEGGVASGFKNIKENPVSASGAKLYHVRGTTSINTRAVQVVAKATSLNGGDCFVVLTDSTAFVWLGRGANRDEQTVAGTVGALLAGKRKVTTVNELAEPAEFWSAVGGKGSYPTTKETEIRREPRLFQLALRGDFSAEEVPNYSQDDLINDDVMLLDVYSEVYVWVGHGSSKEEKDLAFTTAMEFVKKVKDGRSVDTPIYVIKAGSEPPTFTCHFLGWDHRKAQDFSDPYLKKLGQLGVSSSAPRGASIGSHVTSSSSSSASAAPVLLTSNMVGFADSNVKYTAAQLRSGAFDNIDVKKKENYLSDAEFAEVFGMARVQFNALPAWKQSDKKKSVGLF